MIDISVFTVEERLTAAVWVHDRIRNDMTMEDIRSAFTERFGKPRHQEVICICGRRKFLKQVAIWIRQEVAGLKHERKRVLVFKNHCNSPPRNPPENVLLNLEYQGLP